MCVSAGVTEMRMGQLEGAKASFSKAQKLLQVPFEGSSLEKNVAALQEHIDFQEKSKGGKSADESDEYWDEYEEDEEDVPVDQVRALTDSAIAKAEANDMPSALLLFQKAAHLNPRSFKQHENVAVTMMVSLIPRNELSRRVVPYPSACS
jgi:tetratricopeptide (TPR) repeat protein